MRDDLVVLFQHRGGQPRVSLDAYVAPTAVVAGNVVIEEGVRILFGAVVTAEDGEISLGKRTVVMENALIRARARHPVRIGDDVVIGPHAHVNGATVGAEGFIATGASLFPGAFVPAQTEVRIGAVLHAFSRLEPRQHLPIGWIAVGDPATLHPPSAADALRTRFWEAVSESDAPLAAQYSEFFAPHREDIAN